MYLILSATTGIQSTPVVPVPTNSSTATSAAPSGAATPASGSTASTATATQSQLSVSRRTPANSALRRAAIDLVILNCLLLYDPPGPDKLIIFRLAVGSSYGNLTWKFQKLFWGFSKCALRLIGGSPVQSTDSP
jgi:hypothetical protein